jgi:tetratricopeptide (TPR) repeat protein
MIVLLLLLFAAVPQFDSVAKLAAAARESNQPGDAIRLYREAVRLRPAWSEGWWYLGTLLYETDQYGPARDAFARLTKLDTEGGPGWAMLGLCEYQTREYASAFMHLRQALKLGFGENAQLTHIARYHSALLLTHFAQFEDALQLYTRLAVDGIDDRNAIAAAGIAALRMPLLPPELPTSRHEIVLAVGRAVYDTAARRAADAKREWQEIAAKYGDQPNIHYLYGGFLLLSDANAALLEWKRELEISPEHVPARLELAYEYLKRGDTASALLYAKAAVKLQPESFTAHNALGRVLAESGDLTGAIAELEEACKIAPEIAENRVALASAYAKAGRKNDAARERALFLKLKSEQQP